MYDFAGLKPQLVARLTKAIKAEEAEATSANQENDDIAGDADDQNANKANSDAQECLSNDGMDIDLADIVVIDEYDSTKNDKPEESSKKVRIDCIEFL